MTQEKITVKTGEIRIYGVPLEMVKDRFGSIDKVTDEDYLTMAEENGTVWSLCNFLTIISLDLCDNKVEPYQNLILRTYLVGNQGEDDYTRLCSSSGQVANTLTIIERGE